SHDAPIEDLLNCIESTTLQRSFYCNITLRNTLDHLSNLRKSAIHDSKSLTKESIRPHLLYSKLSNRQQEIIQLIFQGKSTSQIGSLLNLKLSTISTMKSQILKKMQVSNVIELVKIYSVLPE
ncbi:MAG TPA: LuxR C-terminal-related transcriptional regulator, partial [Dyadobacter sp.]|nr:LuxR C-terminal-related transcriptional regulator [Dyadobacter sp.]